MFKRRNMPRRLARLQRGIIDGGLLGLALISRRRAVVSSGGGGGGGFPANSIYIDSVAVLIDGAPIVIT